MAEEVKEDKLDQFFSNDANAEFSKKSKVEKEEPVASDDESEEEAPDSEVDEEEADEDDSEDSEEEDKKVDWEKKYKKADQDRRKTQSEKDSILSVFKQQKQTLDILMKEVQELKNTRTENPESSLDIGSEDELLTVGQFKKAVEHLTKATQKQQNTETITPDMYNEGQTAWINSQQDREKVARWLEQNPVDYDPELSSMNTQEGRYVQIRNKLLREELQSVLEENKRLKKQEKKAKKKGRVPITGPGQGRSSASLKGSDADPLERFMQGW